MRRLALRWLTLATFAACGGGEPAEDPVADARAYVDDARARRNALEASVSTDPYSQLRLAHYALSGSDAPNEDEDWDALPELAARVRPLLVRGATIEPEEGAPVATLPEDLGTLAELEAAGALAFSRYPAQIDLGLHVLRERADAERAGFDVSDVGVVRGAIEIETGSGWQVALTCSACHSAERDGTWIDGLANERLDLGWLFGSSWPVGTIDVTADEVDDPSRPSDLRPIALQARLQHTGDLANGRLARMVRIETLLTVQAGQRYRPDRKLVAALALYLEALADTLPNVAQEGAGRDAFATHCGSCHRSESLAGPTVAAEVVGTGSLGTSGGSERATGGWRAPSLRGAAERIGVFHDGRARDLDAVLGLTESEHVGHPFGRDADEEVRRSIRAFLAAGE